jgi:hypothetical protein
MGTRRRKGRRSFGATRRLPSGRQQASYLGPDGLRRVAPQTFPEAADANVAVTCSGQPAMGYQPIEVLRVMSCTAPLWNVCDDVVTSGLRRCVRGDLAELLSGLLTVRLQAWPGDCQPTLIVGTDGPRLASLSGNGSLCRFVQTLPVEVTIESWRRLCPRSGYVPPSQP